jgi:UDP:flavonoid glycosyltransferase YjiC (YdhE family)
VVRITIPTTGSRGDVQPYVALGAGLRRAGHRVRLATHADFEAMARRNGLEFFAVEASGRELHGTATADRMPRAGGNPFVFLREFARLRQPLVRSLLANTWEACADTDLVLLTPTALLVGWSAAEKRGLPTCWTSLQPTSPSRHLANFLFPDWPPRLPGAGAYNLLTHWVAGEVLWQFIRPALNEARREALDLPPLPLPGPLDLMFAPTPRLYGYSAHLVPPPPDWGDNHHVTGFWFLDAAPDWTPPPGLEEFLAAGPPPVYVGFGSMRDRDASAVTALVLEALSRAGRRGVLHTGWGGLREVPPSERFFPVGPVPHDWLFPRVAAAVHHGGAGTVAAALRAGIPSVLVPFMADQPFWARRLFALGVAPAPVPRKRLTAERLAAAIRAAVEGPEIRRRAAELGAKVRAEGGVGRAVAVLDAYARRLPAPARPERARADKLRGLRQQAATAE